MSAIWTWVIYYIGTPFLHSFWPLIWRDLWYGTPFLCLFRPQNLSELWYITPFCIYSAHSTWVIYGMVHNFCIYSGYWYWGISGTLYHSACIQSIELEWFMACNIILHKFWSLNLSDYDTVHCFCIYGGHWTIYYKVHYSVFIRAIEPEGFMVCYTRLQLFCDWT
jgi:hypothetical protein